MDKRKPRADGLYQVKVYLGKVDGKVKYKYVYGATQEEAEDKARDVKAKMKKGLDVTAERESFGIWAGRWLRLKKMDVGPSQYRCCEGFLKHFDSINSLPISKVSANDVQEIIIDLAEHNPTTGKPTSKRTLNAIKNAAGQIIQLAVDNRAIDYNPIVAVRVPRGAPQEARRALTDQEQSWITETNHPMQIAAMIMLFSGLRRGEVVALSWDDIDLDARTISVNKSADMSANKTIIKRGAKTKAGCRVVDIPQRLVDYLSNIEKERPLVCPGKNGGIYTGAYWRTSWDSYILHLDMLHGSYGRKHRFDPRFKGVSIEPITPHMLRHTFCTMLYFAGVDVLTAQQQMGHADARTTLGIYTHLDVTYKRRQMNKLDDYINSAYIGCSEKPVTVES